MTVDASRREGTAAPRGRPRPTRAWRWPAAWLVVALAAARLVRLPGPATLDPDEHAAALYFDRLVGGQRLEDPLLSTPKPLLTVVHGVAWAASHDWRVLEALAVAAFALAVVALARATCRLAGPPAALAAAVAVAGSGPVVLQAARGNSLVFALAGWAVALDALTAGRRRWALAAAALTLAGLARSETWPLAGLAAATVLAARFAHHGGARRGRARHTPSEYPVDPGGDGPGPDAGRTRHTPSEHPVDPGGGSGPDAGRTRRRPDPGAMWLLLPLCAPLLWLAHDWLLTGDPAYSLRVPERYTDLVSGRHPVTPAAWAALVGDRYGRSPLLLALAAAGVVWLVRRRAWLWLAAIVTVTVGLLVLFGVEASRGTYVSFRYLDPVDVGVRLAAALGTGWLAGAVAGRLRRIPGPARLAAATAVAAVLAGGACWPLAPADPEVRSTLDRDTRLSANAATAVRLLRPIATAPGTVVAVSGPQRTRIAVELGLPLGRVRDLFLASLHAPLDQALAGSAAVFHDGDGDRPTGRFAPLTTTRPTRVGSVEVVPLRTDPARGLYVHKVRSVG